jgi:dihydroorotate dehydrogenase electron transfer subunit
MPVIEDTKIIEKVQINPHLYLFKLQAPKIARLSRPGQFVEIDPGDEFFLRRPFSIQDAYEDIIELLIKVVGRGTEALVIKTSDWNLLGPLGNNFSPREGQKILVAGGVGFAPLKFLYMSMRRSGINSEFIYGAQNIDNIPFSKGDQVFKELDIATEDGSFGIKGTAIDLLQRRLKKNSQYYIYACGPLPMLSALRDLMLERGWGGEFALESRMGCGVGVCQGCAVPIKTEYKLVCKDGPVFDYRNIREEFWCQK